MKSATVNLGSSAACTMPQLKILVYFLYLSSCRGLNLHVESTSCFLTNAACTLPDLSAIQFEKSSSRFFRISCCCRVIVLIWLIAFSSKNAQLPNCQNHFFPPKTESTKQHWNNLKGSENVLASGDILCDSIWNATMPIYDQKCFKCFGQAP